MRKTDIRGIIFDFGGTLDTGGDHWFQVFYDCTRALGYNFAEETFRQAYIYGEKSVSKISPAFIENPVSEFYREILTTKLIGQAEYLLSSGGVKNFSRQEYIIRMRNYAYGIAWDATRKAEKVLEALHPFYQMGIVSNYYGCLSSVLTELGLKRYFGIVIDSACVDLRKPNPEIFLKGIEKFKFKPEEILVVGDSFTNDIEPAASLGCRTVWLKRRGWDDVTQKSCEASQQTMVIKDLEQLKTICGL